MWSENAYIFKDADKQFFRKKALEEFHVIRKLIGRPDLRPHDLRHTGARRKLKETSNVLAVRDFLRHTHLGTTIEYLYTTKEDMKEGIEKLDRWYKEHFDY